MQFGPNNLKRLTKILNRDIEYNDEIQLTMDWSKFDKKIPVWLIEMAFDVVE